MDVVAGSIAAALAFTFCIVLVAKWVRSRSPYYGVWAVSMLCFALGSAALAWGAAAGWPETAFRVYYLFGAVLTVPWLALGSVYVLRRGRPHTGTMMAIDASIVYFTVIATAVVMNSALQGAIPTTGIPEGRELMVPAARALAVVGNIVGTLVVVGGALWSATRAWTERSDKALFHGNLLIAGGVAVAAASGVSLGIGLVTSKAVWLAIAEALIFAGFLVATGGLRFRRRSTAVEVAPAPDSRAEAGGAVTSAGLALDALAAGPAWPAQRKADAVLAVIRSGDLGETAHDLGIEPAALSVWRDAFIAAGSEELSTPTPADDRWPSESHAGLDAAHRKVGELTMEVDRLRRLVETTRGERGLDTDSDADSVWAD